MSWTAIQYVTTYLSYQSFVSSPNTRGREGMVGSRDSVSSVICLATFYGLDGSGFEPRWLWQVFFCWSYRSRAYNQHIIQQTHFVTQHIRYTKTSTCFGTEVPSSGIYYNKGIQANLPIYVLAGWLLCLPKHILIQSYFIPTCQWRWNGQSVPKRRHIKFRRRGITQKKA